MVLTIKVKVLDTEKVKQQIYEYIDRNYKMKKEKDFIFIPIKDEIKKDKKLNKSKGLIYENKKLESNIKINNIFDYLKSNKILSSKDLELVPSSFDIIGNIAILEIDDEVKKIEKKIANAILEVHNNIKTVVKKASEHKGEFRIQKTKHLSGKRNKITTHKESGINLKLNIDDVYFSSRSGNERLRIAKQVKKGENVLIMFSGIAPFNLVIAKNSQAKKIYGIEKNPIGHKYAIESLNLNKSIKSLNQIELIKGDVKKEIPKLIKKGIKFDRIVMPLPRIAKDFLEDAIKVSKKGTIIHLYAFPETEKKEEYITEVLKAHKRLKLISTNICGTFSPKVSRVCYDLKVK